MVVSFMAVVRSSVAAFWRRQRVTYCSGASPISAANFAEKAERDMGQIKGTRSASPFFLLEAEPQGDHKAHQRKEADRQGVEPDQRAYHRTTPSRRRTAFQPVNRKRRSGLTRSFRHGHTKGKRTVPRDRSASPLFSFTISREDKSICSERSQYSRDHTTMRPSSQPVARSLPSGENDTGALAAVDRLIAFRNEWAFHTWTSP